MYKLYFEVTLMNLAVVMTIRILLDSEDEINEPIIKGPLRERLTIFLGIFTMTFFFGCWCCFCCGCMLCKYKQLETTLSSLLALRTGKPFFVWMLDCPDICGSLLTAASFKFISSHPSIRRRFHKEEDGMNNSPTFECEQCQSVEQGGLTPRKGKCFSLVSIHISCQFDAVSSQ
ncbi:hypothetical protein ANCCAN_25650 [Ancylostoma caninum]|uniref:Uncharacterized protein n=1 Tax=Ancylostoma caninum TaxID=29170 RepID=A0A368F922_ANCCA|nr:hypothetical protein ANCCAN_25650 [Ancylostoma caninum]